MVEDNFRNYIENNISVPTSNKLTEVYIQNIFVNFLKNDLDYSKESLTLIYQDAITDFNFQKWQNLGDWLFFVKTLFPEHLSNASEKYYNALAQSSYFKCYLILRKEMKIFEELADEFPKFTSHLRHTLNQTSFSNYLSFF